MAAKTCWIGFALAAQLAWGGAANAQQDQATDPGWPRQLDSQAGALVLYEPQPDTFQGQTLNARAAFSLTPTGKTEPLFGALWFTAQVNTDREQRLVQVASAKVTEVKLPDSASDTQAILASLVEQQLANVTFPLDRLTEGLADTQEEHSTAPELKFDPPKILFATEPTVLVLLDGQPIRRPIEKSGIDAVVNTPFPLFYDPRAQSYYLTNGAIWYQAYDVLQGPWTVIPVPPPEVAAVVAKGDKKDQSEPVAKDATPPRVVVATEPTELVVTKGPPNFAPVNDTQLLQVTNADESIFRDLTSQRVFVVLAGRWYTAPAFNGPWRYVPSDKLPPDFAKIPAASPAGNVLAFVSGTPEAKQAVADAEIPQTAEVKRDAPPPTPPTYDGQPDFQPIAGAAPGVSYAVNSPGSVLQIDGTYYSVVNGVWYLAPGPTGPWSVATAVPPQVQTIPPASPVYNVRYVYVYQATPTVVYTGYTPGYLGCYAYGGTVVYGTGYVYRPWVSGAVYYPRPVTWGFGVAYNPYTGWSYGVGVSAGFLYYGATWGGAYYRPAWRPLYGGAWYGPGGYRPPPYAYGGGWYSPGYRAAYYRPGTPYYRGYAGYAGHPGYGAWAHPAGGLYARPGFAHAMVQRPPMRPVYMGHPASPAARSMNVVADRRGNVLRQNPNGSWQQHDNQGGWKSASAPSHVGSPSLTHANGYAAGASGHAVSSGNPGHAGPSTAASGHPVSPAAQSHAGPPAGHPPGGQTSAGPAGSHAGPPGAGSHAGPPGAQSHAGPPGAQSHAGPPGAQSHAGPPGGHPAPPGGQSHAAPPGTSHPSGGSGHTNAQHEKKGK